MAPKAAVPQSEGKDPKMTTPPDSDTTYAGTGDPAQSASPGKHTDAPPANPVADPIQAASAAHRPEARLIEEGFPAVFLGTIVQNGIKHQLSPAAFKSYLDKIIEDSGSPTDPVERQFLEQLVWAHFRIGELHVQSAVEKAPDVAVALNTAAAKLMGEHRKTGLALREYRSPVVTRQITVVQQRPESVGPQNVEVLDATPECPKKIKSDSKLTSNGGRLNGVEPTAPVTTSACRPSKSAQKKGLNGHRPRKATELCADAQTVAPVNGTANGRW